MIPSPYPSELNTCRIIVLLEVKPFSNQYEQLEFTFEQWKKVSDVLWKIYPLSIEFPEPGKKMRAMGETRTITTRDGIITLPDDLECFYGKPE